MLRGICFCICMSVMLSLFAQNEESNFIAPDRTVHKRSEIIKRAIKKFLDFSDFDTAYISPNRYNYALMLDHFTNYEYYSVGNVCVSHQNHIIKQAFTLAGAGFFQDGLLMQTDFTERKTGKKEAESSTSVFTVLNQVWIFFINVPETLTKYTK